jgi:uncharacterized protein (DUF2267 family)
MLYTSWIDQVMKLPFINDQRAADSAIKAVLGTLASVVSEDEALRLTDRLPPELDFRVLRGHQGELRLTQEQFVASIAGQMHLQAGEGLQLVERVFHCVKETEEGAEMMEEIQSLVPSDWRDMVDRA